MKRYIGALIIVLATTGAFAAETRSAAGVWVAVEADATYTLRLKGVYADEERTIERLDGTLTVSTMRGNGVTVRKVAVTGQFLIAEKENVVLSFGDQGQMREYATGIYWQGSLEMIVFSIRSGGNIDFKASTTFNRRVPEVPPATTHT